MFEIKTTDDVARLTACAAHVFNLIKVTPIESHLNTVDQVVEVIKAMNNGATQVP